MYIPRSSVVPHSTDSIQDNRIRINNKTQKSTNNQTTFSKTLDGNVDLANLTERRRAAIDRESTTHPPTITAERIQYNTRPPRPSTSRTKSASLACHDDVPKCRKSGVSTNPFSICIFGWSGGPDKIRRDVRFGWVVYIVLYSTPLSIPYNRIPKTQKQKQKEKRTHDA